MLVDLTWQSHVRWLQRPGITVAVIPRYLKPLQHLAPLLRATPLSEKPLDLPERHNPDDLLLKLWNNQTTVTERYIWQDFDGLRASHQMLLQLLPQVVLLVDDLQTIRLAPNVDLLKTSYTVYQPTFDYTREIYTDDLPLGDETESSRLKKWFTELGQPERTWLIVPESALTDYRAEYPEYQVTHSGAELSGLPELILNLGLDDVTTTTMTLGQVRQLAIQTRGRQREIESLVHRGQVVHLRSRTRLPSRNLAETVQWFSRYLYTAKADMGWARQTFGDIVDDFQHWFRGQNYLPSSRLNYKLEFLAQHGDLGVQLLASALSAYNGDTLLKVTPAALTWRGPSSIHVLQNIWNTILARWPLQIVDGEANWPWNEVAPQLEEWQLNPEYVLRTLEMLNSLAPPAGTIREIVLTPVVKEFFTTRYFPFTILPPVNPAPTIREAVAGSLDTEIVFRSSEYRSYLESQGLPSSLDYSLTTTDLNLLVEGHPGTVYPLSILTAPREPQVVLFYAAS